MVDDCKGTYYTMEIFRDEKLDVTHQNLHMITDMSCPDGECSECDRMRLVEQVNDYDYSFQSRMEHKAKNGCVYKLRYEDENGDRHLTELVLVGGISYITVKVVVPKGEVKTDVIEDMDYFFSYKDKRLQTELMEVSETFSENF